VRQTLEFGPRKCDGYANRVGRVELERHPLLESFDSGDDPRLELVDISSAIVKNQRNFAERNVDLQKKERQALHDIRPKPDFFLPMDFLKKI